MSVEYDLVVIGGTTVARQAAIAAAMQQARVALVEPQPPELEWLGMGVYSSQIFSRLGRDRLPSDGNRDIDLAGTWECANAVAANIAEPNSLAVLAALGIDCLTGKVEFCRLPRLAVRASNRLLRARAYLLALRSRPRVPQIEGLQAISYLTPANLWSRLSQINFTGEGLPPAWAIIGASPAGIEIAQVLGSLGIETTLVIKGDRLLPREDLETSQMVQALLESAGVKILTCSPVTQAKQIDNKKWVLAGDRAIEVDEVVLAAGWEPETEGLNLEGAGVQLDGGRFLLNEKLQTTNPRIYACSNYHFANIAAWEAKIAVKNALFLPIFKIDRRSLPWTIFSRHAIARVGINASQAKQIYGKDALILHQNFKTLISSHLSGEMSGFCQIIARRNGEILGAAIIGDRAEELISTIALAMQQKIKLSAIADLPAISPASSEIIQQTASQWYELRRDRWRRNFLEGLFNWRRHWF